MSDLTRQNPIHVIGLASGSAVQLSAYSVLLLFIGGALFGAVAGDEPTGTDPLWMLVAFLATIVTHELTHGLFFLVYGGRPSFGVGAVSRMVVYAYATASRPYTLTQFLVIGLSPFVLLSLALLLIAVAFPTLAAYAAVGFIANFVGSVGDVWIASRIWRFRGAEALRLEDRRDAVAVYAEGELALATAQRLAQRERRGSAWSRFLGAWLVAFALTLLLAILAPVVLDAAAIRGDVRIGPEGFALVEYSASSEGGFGATVSFAPAAIAGAAFAAIYTVLRKLAPSRRE
ncbi:MAG: DUF3267 domain-containing protein [Candidatus Limnocylindria bacterium]